MLVLSRKAKQRIVIGGNIELVVIAVDGNRVKLGINAPSDVLIHREEVHRRIRSETGDCGSIGRDNHRGSDSAAVDALMEAEMVLADLIQAKDR